jgi:predicted Rossmann fold flavoprotein
MPRTSEDRTSEHWDVVVIGAGAAGMMCAAIAGQRGRRVLLLEHGAEAGAKILISGGGRCNFTNLGTQPGCFLSENASFCVSALRRYTPQDFLALIGRHAIAWHEKTLGQLFCDGSARQIVDMLLAECRDAGVTVRLGCRVSEISRDGCFRVSTDQGDIRAESVVLATGGPAIPKLGATGFAYEVARRFGLAVVPPRPALVPLTFAGADLALMQGLSGVALDVTAAVERTQFRERMLFTHRGLSGPAILQISSYWQPGAAIRLNLLPDSDAAAHLRARKAARPKAQLGTVLGEILPQRLAEQLVPPELAGRPIAELPNAGLQTLAARLQAWSPLPSGTEGFGKAEVTAGGVATTGLSSRTMQANEVPGLFFIGEAVDVTGWLGGYNFQWAWASGWSAGQVV